MVISLCISWNDNNARFLILSFLFVEAISLLTLDWAMTKPIGYYAWCMLMSLIFIVFVFGRRYWAYKLQRIDFFANAFDKHRYTKQETTLVLIFSLSFIINLVTLIEVYLYYVDVIDNAFIKLYFRDYAQSVLFILAAFVCLSFAMRFSTTGSETNDFR